MHYTSRLPTVPGYYWLKTPESEEIVEVWMDEVLDRRLFIHRCGDGDCCGFDAITDGLWAGPVNRPD